MENHMTKVIYTLCGLIFIMFLLVLFRVWRYELWVATTILLLSGIWFSFSYIHVLKQNMTFAKNYLLFGLITLLLSIVLFIFLLV